MTQPATQTQLTATPGQTIGPFFGYALPFEGDNHLVPPGHSDAVRLHGIVTDGEGTPIPDALLEVWQLDPAGQVVQRPGSLRRDGWTFTGWGRASTNNAGEYSFTTLTPGASEPGKAAFFAITLFSRGVTNRLFTRAYLPGDDAALSADPLLASLDPARRRTLVTSQDETGYRFDIRVQGGDETVFLAFPRG